MTWKAPTNPNGVIQSYLINVTSRMPSTINTTSNITNKIVDGLLPGIVCLTCNVVTLMMEYLLNIPN